MNIITQCPPKVYQDYMSKVLERREQEVYQEPFYKYFQKTFNEGIPVNRAHYMTADVLESKSLTYDFKWLYTQLPVSLELLML